MKLFVDGILESERLSQGYLKTGSPVRIGNHVNTAGPDWYFGGSIDDVGIYNRALSDAEIQNLHSAAPVPEPATVLLFGTGIIGLAGFRKRLFN